MLFQMSKYLVLFLRPFLSTFFPSVRFTCVKWGQFCLHLFQFSLITFFCPPILISSVKKKKNRIKQDVDVNLSIASIFSFHILMTLHSKTCLDLFAISFRWKHSKNMIKTFITQYSQNFSEIVLKKIDFKLS